MGKKKVIARSKPKRKAQFEVAAPPVRKSKFYAQPVVSNLIQRQPKGNWNAVQPILPTAYGWNEHDAITKICNCPKLWVPKGYEETFNKFSEFQKIYYKNLKSNSKRKAYIKHFYGGQKIRHEDKCPSYHCIAETQSIPLMHL